MPSHAHNGRGSINVAAVVQHELQERPYRTLGIAVGVGFVLGSGLWAPIVGIFASRAGRQIATSILTPLFDGISTVEPTTTASA